MVYKTRIRYSSQVTANFTSGFLAVLEREKVSHPLRLFVRLRVTKVGFLSLSVGYDYKYAFLCQYYVFSLAKY